MRTLTGPGPQVPAVNGLLALCAAVQPARNGQVWCQRAFLQQLRPLLVALTPGSRPREADLAVLLLDALPPCTHPTPVNSLDPFDSAHAGVLALVGTRTPEQAAQHIQRGLP